MKLCPECLGRGLVYSPGGYAPKLPCPVCAADATAPSDGALGRQDGLVYQDLKSPTKGGEADRSGQSAEQTIMNLRAAQDAIAPLKDQGEDRIWRPVRKAIATLDVAATDIMLLGEERDALLAQRDALERERDEALLAPWPQWALTIKQTLEEYGVAFEDDSDLGREFVDWVNDYEEACRSQVSALLAERDALERERDEWRLAAKGSEDVVTYLEGRVASALLESGDNLARAEASEQRLSAALEEVERSERVIAGLNKQLTEQFELSTKYTAKWMKAQALLRRVVGAVVPFARVAQEYSTHEADDHEVWRDVSERSIRASARLSHYRALATLSAEIEAVVGEGS